MTVPHVFRRKELQARPRSDWYRADDVCILVLVIGVTITDSHWNEVKIGEINELNSVLPSLRVSSKLGKIVWSCAMDVCACVVIDCLLWISIYLWGGMAIRELSPTTGTNWTFLSKESVGKVWVCISGDESLISLRTICINDMYLMCLSSTFFKLSSRHLRSTVSIVDESGLSEQELLTYHLSRWPASGGSGI